MLKKVECDTMVSQQGYTISTNQLNDKEIKATISLKQGYKHEIVYVCGNQIEIKIIKED
ncbi:MAG: hypothetical protein IKI95_05075 [Clostridia bacterium]|nr:hypothetical protein [Clostridia bacterium]